MECGYKVKINNKEKFLKESSSGEEFFDSEQMLDNWVAENYFRNPKNLERLRKYTKGKNFLFDSADQANAQSIALQNLDGMTKALSERTDITHSTSKRKLSYTWDARLDVWTLDAESSTYYKRLVSVTDYINSTGNRRDLKKGAVTASNQDDYEMRLRQEVEQDMRLNDRQAWVNQYGDGDDANAQWEAKIKARQDEIVEKYRKKRLYAQLIGDDIHHMMEFHAHNKMGETASLIPGYILSKADQEAEKDSTKQIFDDICAKYNFSKNAVFLPEFEIFGDNLDNATKRILEEKTGKQFDGIFGRVDLLVIDNGKAYIFDFKTTAEKEVGDWQEMDNSILRKNGWWSSTKKLEAMEQIAMYLAILESWGIEAGGGEVVPITINYENDEDGYPTNIVTTEITEDGKSIIQAPTSGDHRNIKGLYLDRSAEKWPETEKGRRSSAHRIMNTYLPWARSNISLVSPLNIKQLSDINSDMEFVFPTKFNEGSRTFAVTVNYYLGKDEEGKQIGESRIIPLASDDIHRTKGFSYKMYTSPKVNLFKALANSGKSSFIDKFGIISSDGAPIYFKSNEESEVREILEIYCRELNQVLSEEFYTLASDLKNIMQIGGRDTSEVADSFSKLLGENPSRHEYMKQMFGKYFDGSWNLYGAGDTENELVQNGVFIFYKDKTIEVVMLSHDPLHYEVNFGTKRRPLKSITNGLVQTPEDNWSVLTSSKGNMLLIKAMDIISKDPNIYRNGEAKIRSIIAINPWHMQSTWTDNDFLLSNWNRICSLSKGRLTALPKSVFYSSTEAALDTAREMLKYTSLWGSIDGIFTNQLKTESEIIKLINIIKSKSKKSFNDDGTPKVDTEIGYSVWCLLNALAINRGLRIPMEHDTGKILESGILPTGPYMNAPGNASKVTVRTLDKLTGQFNQVYKGINDERIDELNKRVRIIYEKCNFNPNAMSRKEFWARFFEKNDKGQVASQMRIINFGNTEFWGKQDPEVKIAFKYILDTLAQYKNIVPTADFPTYELKDPNKYYEIPLTRGSFGDSLAKSIGNEGIKGVYEVVKDRVKNIKNKAETLYFGDEEIYMKDGKTDDQDLLKALTNSYCVYDESDRERWCSNNTIAYTTDLEVILGTAVAAQAISETSATYGHLYAALKCALAVNELFGGEKVPEISEYIQDYITRIYKGNSIMNASNRGLAGLIGAVKGITSKMTLGFNTRAFTREMLVSLYTGFLRAGNSRIEGIDAEDFAFGLGYVFKTAPANINKSELVGQLNRRYRMAGQSRSDLPKANFINDFALRTVDMDNLAYMGTTIPDNYFRVAILIAKMHADNCFESYSLDENGVLKYDAKKDNRFKKYLTNDSVPIFKEYDSSMGSHTAYNKARALWNSYIDEWRLVYPDQNIVTLPEAYPPSVNRSIQQRAGILYGFFDDDQKSLMSYQFIGSAIMQYKTWLSAKIDQWIKKPGFTNIWRQVHKQDLDGNYLYILTHSQAEIESGKPPLEFIPESEVTEEMVKAGVVTPYIVEEGTYSEGMIQSTFSFAGALLSMDTEEFLNMWNDPMMRGNFICGFVDMFGMMLFAMLVNMLFGDDVINNKGSQNWITQWTYGVLTGFAEDGPVHQVLGSMIGDWNPPSLLTIQRIARTTQSVLAGNKTVPQGFIESFGATKELSGFFRE